MLALGILVVLTISAASLLNYSSSDQRGARLGRNQQLAYSLAEAGINEASAVLNLTSNNALTPTLLAQRTSTYSTGTVTWSGALDQQTSIWTVTSTAHVANPTGGGGTEITKTLTAKIPVTPTVTETLNSQAWNYIYSSGTGQTCDMTITQSVNVATPLYVEGNLCLQNTSKITRGPLVVKGRLTLSQQQNIVGSASAKISDAHIGNGCRYKNNPVHTPCQGAVDNVYANVLDTSPTTIAPITLDWDGWYQNANPGPKFPCNASMSSASSTWPVFDNDTTRNKSVSTAWNLTPGTSYDCKTSAGEITWDAVAKQLTMNGTVFIDGSAYINNGALNTYSGQASLYLSGTFFMQGGYLCAVKKSDNSGCDTVSWDPNTRLLVVVANGNADNGIPTGDSIQIKSATLQGALFGTNNIDVDTTALVDGPMAGHEVKLGQSVSTSFPFINIVPAATPGQQNVYAQAGAPASYSG